MATRRENSHRDGPTGNKGQTVLAMPTRDRLVMFIGLPLAGLLLAVLLPPLARWALAQNSGLPMRPVFWALRSIDEPWKIAVSAALGILAGLGIALAAHRESTTVLASDAELAFKGQNWSRTIPRPDVAAAFLDGKTLVVLDNESRMLARERLESPRDAVARAFREHGYPWRDGDPYADLYRRWVPDASDLPAEVNAMLAAREATLKKKGGRESRDLRDGLQRLGYVVREDGTKQFWRPLVRS